MLVVFTSIVFQFWKKLFAVVMSPMVPALAIVPQDKSAPSFVRYFPDAPEVEGESLCNVNGAISWSNSRTNIVDTYNLVSVT